MRGFYWVKIEHWGGHALLRLKSVIHNTLKIICLFFRTHRYKYRSIILFFLIPCTLYLIPAMLPAASAATVTLGWSPNDEPDLEGYFVYRNPEEPGPPYKYSNELPEDDLDDPLNPRLKLTGLMNETKYYVALTAYNNEGIESSFSNEVCIEVIENAIQACSEAVSPSTNTSSSSGGSGGGGGGGCFISTASHHPPNNHLLFYILFTLTIIGIGTYCYTTKAKKQ